jgi:hypothetical protein
MQGVFSFLLAFINYAGFDSIIFIFKCAAKGHHALPRQFYVYSHGVFRSKYRLFEKPVGDSRPTCPCVARYPNRGRSFKKNAAHCNNRSARRQDFGVGDKTAGPF